MLRSVFKYSVSRHTIYPTPLCVFSSCFREGFPNFVFVFLYCTMCVLLLVSSLYFFCGILFYCFGSGIFVCWFLAFSLVVALPQMVTSFFLLSAAVNRLSSWGNMEEITGTLRTRTHTHTHTHSSIATPSGKARNGLTSRITQLGNLIWYH